MFLSVQVLDRVEERRETSRAAVFTFLKAINENPFPRPVSRFEMFCFLLSAATKLDCDGIYFFVITGALSQSQSTKGMCNTYTE